MADPVTAVVAVAAVASGGAKAYSQYEAEKAQLNKLKMERQVKTVQYQQQTLANLDNTNKLLDADLAAASTRGVSLGSSSLEAIARDTMNVGAKNEKNLNIENTLTQGALKAEEQNIRDTLWAQIFGDVAEGVTQGAMIYNGMPKGATK